MSRKDKSVWEREKRIPSRKFEVHFHDEYTLVPVLPHMLLRQKMAWNIDEAESKGGFPQPCHSPAMPEPDHTHRPMKPKKMTNWP